MPAIQPAMTNEIEVEMFSRPNCHLCDVALEVIGALEEHYPLKLRVINVETEPQLEQQFGTELPVVRIGGQTLFKYPIEGAALERELKRLWNQ